MPDTQAYRQFGNTIIVPVVEAVMPWLVDDADREPERPERIMALAGRCSPAPVRFIAGLRLQANAVSDELAADLVEPAHQENGSVPAAMRVSSFTQANFHRISILANGFDLASSLAEPFFAHP